MWRWPYIVRWGLSRWRPACNLMPVCYNATIQEQSLGIHYNSSKDLLDLHLRSLGLCLCRRHVGIRKDQGLALRSTKKRSSVLRSMAIVGAHPCGVIQMALSRSGEMTETLPRRPPADATS